MRKEVLVLGGNFGGLNAALGVKHELEGDVDVTVVSAAERFLFNPSLIWLPFGRRSPADITFPLAPTFGMHGVEFVHAAATVIDPQARVVHTTKGVHNYDYLVIATGYRNTFDVLPGFESADGAYTITTLEDAIRPGEGWRRFLDDPGPVVIGATQGAGCFGAAYEFLFDTAYQVKKAGLRGRAPLTYVTAEPFLGQFGIGGLPGGEKLLRMFCKKEGIQTVTGVAMQELAPGKLRLADGQDLHYAYAMIVPPFTGQDVVSAVPGLADDKGFVPVRDTYQSLAYPEVYPVGVAAAVQVPWTTAILAVCVMDAGANGVMILADRMLPPRKFGVMIPRPQSHLAKLMFEKYFVWKSRHGYVRLP
ncbi:NAD(P)/FAD-dependent oxidoreductase [Nonomuraea fuscirosea]|uniref:NAD(P)/FAD-dependent oxidoreductase n=1 Tax=Nonomuraea fuscirosea TaxID=1291556 RepID=UPI0033D5A8B8